ncbi:TROVE domain-containing protein [Bacteroides sp.]|uniref:TROVE domain-containing protein n=1 Tax=Bacteroides sp. TaxID=29523 RepID=UPI002612DB84|nr:TROVE domain-containing protein [Bacteroides sp.]MDD3040556.1 TROVE domain-containing protein [Bacteroides sp.]
MAGKFNRSLEKTAVIRNKAGGLAEALPPKEELMTRVFTCFVNEPGAYGNADAELIALANRVLIRDPEYVLKLAVYARHEMHMRSVPILLWTLYANSGNKTVVNAADYGCAIVSRADEILELMSAQKGMFPDQRRPFNSVRLPRITKVVIRRSLNKFDAYQFAKYNGGSGEFRFRDAIFLTHPTPKDIEQQKIFQSLVDETIESADTWEHAISTLGSNKQAWTDMIPKMGYMGLLRNLRNFESHKISASLIAPRLTNPHAVANSKQFPFRFLSAYKMVETTEYKRITEEAMEVSIGNIPKIQGRTLILVDVSGSMDSPLSGKSSMTRYDIAGLFGAICPKIFQQHTLVSFATDFQQVILPKELSSLACARMMRSVNVGWSTEAWKPIDAIIRAKMVYDRILIVSDMQCYSSRGTSASVSSLFDRYLHEVNPNCRIYSIDLAGYGTAQVNIQNPNVYLLAGWSEKILNLIPMVETEDMVSIIESYTNTVR